MRVPFPLRVMLSYLLVLIVGALPTFIYLEVLFQERLAVHEVKHLVKRVQRLSTLLPHLSNAQRVQMLQRFSHVMNERVTLIDQKGNVLFDSSVQHIKKMDNHRERLEVRLALGDTPSKASFDPKLPGVGVARRFSHSTQRETLYVAVRILPQSGMPSSVLRISVPASRVTTLKKALLQVFRNSLAGAISVALVLSLLSAWVFSRPLQEVAQAAQDLAEGDYTISLKQLSNDEIGDVGRSLQQLSVELRRRLALAEASDVLLLQMVEVAPTPLVVFDESGSIHTLNGASRRLFETRSEGAVEIVSRWIDSSVFQRVWEHALDSQMPQSITLELEGRDDVFGVVHVIQHPSGASFGVFIVTPHKLKKHSFLPRPSEVKPKPMHVVIEQSIQHVQPTLERFNLSVVRAKDRQSISVAEAQRRLMLSLAAALENVAMATKEGEPINLRFEEHPLFVHVTLEAKVSSFTVEMIRHILNPIGGSILTASNECTLQWPKA